MFKHCVLCVLAVFIYFLGGKIIFFVLVLVALFINTTSLWKEDRPVRHTGEVTRCKWNISSKKILSKKYVIVSGRGPSKLREELNKSATCVKSDHLLSQGNNRIQFQRFGGHLGEVNMSSPKIRGDDGSPDVGRIPFTRRNDRSSIERTSDSSNRSSSVSLTVGEFPLISLVSSLHEAVSPKPQRLKPSPLRIRIQPPTSPEVSPEVTADPVVSVLKQIASNKRVFISTGVGDEEQKEKRSSGMPRHDLTHSLLESQLTTSSVSRDVSSMKRERDEGNSPTGAGATGSSSSYTTPTSAAKRLCARSLRSNEILSSLSSSMSLGSSHTPAKHYMGKRKSVSYDKYKKMRKVDFINKVTGPVKVDKSVATCDLPEKPSTREVLPVISIKRDDISERVVSRAMVSALLKSTVSKLMVSGDPFSYPVPCGTQVRQPEVTPAQFGPIDSPALAYHGSKAPTALTPQTSLGSVTSSSTVSNSQPVTTSSTLSSSQTLFSFDKPQVSLAGGVPSFGLDSKLTVVTTSSTTPSLQFSSTTTSSASPTPPSFGIPSTANQVSAAPPSFGIPSNSSGVSVSASFIVPSTSSEASVAPPNLGVSSSSSGISSSVPSFSSISSPVVTTSQAVLAFGGSDQLVKVPLTTSTPSFGLTSVPSSSATRTFSFGSSSNEVKTSTASRSFSSVVAGSAATPTFGVGSTLPNLFTSVSKPTTSVAFGDSTPNSTTTSSIFGGVSSANVLAFCGVTPISTTATASSTVATTSSSVFGSMTSMSTPVFGSSGSTVASVKSPSPAISTSSTIFGSSTPLFSGASTTPAFGTSVVTTSSIIFGGNPAVTSTGIFGANSTPVFGTAATTTTAAPIFGAATTIAVPVFGAATTTAAPIFGAATTAAVSIFGASTTTTPSIFGATATTTTAPVFGAAATTTTPIFGAAATTTSPLFGASTTTASATSAPIFGSFTGSSTTSTAPIFGATTSTASNLFGGVSSSSVNPIFGSTATTATPIFGANTATPVFGSASAPTTSTPIFGGSTTSLTPSSGPLFGGVTTTTTTTHFGSAGTTGTFTASSFGSSASSSAKPGESLFGMPSSSGYKTASPFQIPSGNEGVSSTSSFSSPKPFEFGGGKSGGFTFKPSGTATAFTSQAQPAAVTSTTLSFPQPSAQSSFSFSGGGNITSPNNSNSMFVFGTPSSPAAAPVGSTAVTAGSGKPFQFGISPSGTTTPSFGQSFAPAFAQSSPAPNMSFASPASQTAQPGFHFNTGVQPAPSTPGSAGGLFSIGTGSSGSRARGRRDRRRRV